MEFSHLEKLSKYTFYRGRVALYAILKTLGIRKGSEVALQAFTCSALIEAIVKTGARPLFIEVEEKGVTLDPFDLAKKISHKTKAIIVQHTFGIPANLEGILQVARQNGVPLIEDCCPTVFSKFNGRWVGTFGKASFCSFEYGKPIALGLGGAAWFNEEDPIQTRLFEEAYLKFKDPKPSLQILSHYYSTRFFRSSRYYWVTRSLYHWGSQYGLFKKNIHIHPKEFNFQMDLFLKKKLKRFLENKLNRIENKQNHLKRLNKVFQRTTQIRIHPKAEPVFSAYPIFVKDKHQALELAKKYNIALSDVYRSPVHPLTGKELEDIGYQRGSCPHAENAATTIVSLPFFEKFDEKHWQRIEKFRDKLVTNGLLVS